MCNLRCHDAAASHCDARHVQALLEYYDECAEVLASWGYAVLQYNLACLLPLPLCIYLEWNTTAEERALPAVLSWAREELSRHKDVQAQFVWHTVGVAGHTRGGGIAFHQVFNEDVYKDISKNVSITSAVLLDRVSLFTITPSAAKAMPVLLAGARSDQLRYLINQPTGLGHA
jgi:hypothetical protein